MGYVREDPHPLVMAPFADCCHVIRGQNGGNHRTVAGDAVGTFPLCFEHPVMQALGEFIKLAAMAFSAGRGNILVIDGALRVARAVNARMGFLGTCGKGIPSVAFIAGHPVFLVYRALPAMGLRPDEAAAGKLRMTGDTGVLQFSLWCSVRRCRELQYAAQQEQAKDNAISS
jgi:hypothetical protein